jgi:glycerate 2-kinase
VKVLIAPDSFKGSLSAEAAATAIQEGLTRVRRDANCLLRPVSDGGEGFLSCILASRDGKLVDVEVSGVLGDPKTCGYATLTSSATAVIEAAAACGLQGLRDAELDVLRATSYGVGQLIAHALDQGATEIVVGLGGSATNDGGLGCLQALGYRLFDEHDAVIDTPASAKDLARVAKLDASRLRSLPATLRVRLACDVNNVLLGENGASRTFAGQKGATARQIELLEEGMQNWAQVLREATGRDIAAIPGSGAAGGLAAGLLALDEASLESGIELVLDTIHFDGDLEDCDLVVAGEGAMDRQTAFGKAPIGVCRRAKAAGVPVLGLAGALLPDANDLFNHGFDMLEAAVCRPMSLSEALETAPALLADAAERALRAWRSTASF